MDADLFLQQFGHLAQGENGIKKLRDVILQLAVRGKLVERNPADEPASELLKRIEAEKKRLLKDGSIKKANQLLDFSDADCLFELPRGWVWERLGNIGETNIGLTYSPNDIAEQGIPVLRSNNIKNGKLNLTDLVRVKSEIKEGIFVNEGDLLICARNGSRALVGKTAMIKGLKEPAAFGAFMAIFRSDLNEYIYHFICSPLFRQVIEEVNTTTINQITQANLRSTLAPIPPLAEQKRIVAKVDELMALCDRLEAEQKMQRTLKIQTVQSTFHHLTTAEKPGKFSTSLNILEQKFENWFDNLTTLKHLRATILQLAVQGKLVPQDINEQLVNEKPDSDPMFLTPENWKWVSLKSITDKIGSGSTPRGGQKAYSKEGIPFLRSQNVWNHGLELKNVAFITEITHQKMKGTCVIPSDVLLNITGASIGRCAKVPSTIKEANVSQHVSIIRLTNILYRDFIHLLLIAPSYQELIMNVQVGMSREGLSKGRLEKFAIPLPPLAEQKRIVAKVDELMTLCDQLEAHITQAQTLNTHLMDSLIHRMTEAA